MLPLALAPSSVLAVALEAVTALLALGLYSGRVRVLARLGRAPESWRQACFYGALLLAALAVVLLDTPSREMAVWHALSDVLTGDLAPLLFVLGLTGPVLAPLARLPGLSLSRRLSNPVVACAIWALDLWGWHLPRLYEAALRHSYIHAVEYLVSFAAGALMWVSLLGPGPRPRWFGDGAKALYAIAVRLAGIVLGNLLLWAGGVVYTYYLQEDARRQFSPVADENLAGALLLLDQAIMLLGVFLWLYLRARAQGSRAEQAPSAPSLTASG